jgi:AraC-like DNA-binding protein
MIQDRLDDYFFGAVAVLVALALYHSFRAPRTAFNTVLQVFLLFLATHLLNGLFIALEFQGALIHWFKLPYAANAVIVSSAFLYLRKLVRNQTDWVASDIGYAVPPVLVISAMLPFYMSSEDNKRNVWNGLGNHGLFMGSEAVAALVLVAAILVFQILQVVDYRRFRNGAYWSSNSRQSEEILHWIRFVNYVIGILAIFSLAYIAMRWSGAVETVNGSFRILFHGTDLVLLFYLASHPKLFRGLPVEHVPKAKGPNSMVINVLERIRDSGLYLDPELTLYRVALEWGIAPSVLSQLIKEQTHQNFSQFVNAQRITHCKGLLLSQSWANQTIEAVGLRSGFASRASFYRAFQQFEQCTPTNWLAKQLPEK